MLDFGALKILYKFNFPLFSIIYHHYQKWIFIIYFLPWAISCVCYHWKGKNNKFDRLFILLFLISHSKQNSCFQFKKSRIKTRGTTAYGAVQLGILARYLSVLDSWFNIFIPKFTLKSTLHLIISWRHISWLKESSWVCLLASFVKSQTLQPIKTIALLNAQFPGGVYFWTRTFFLTSFLC